MLPGPQNPNRLCSVAVSSRTAERCNSRHISARRPGVVVSWVGAIALSLLTGCGGGPKAVPTGNVSGKVTVAGKPLVAGRINFISDKLGVGAGGDLSTDGSYKLDGAVPLGVYDVFLTFNIAPSQIGTPAEDVRKSVPTKYLGQKTSKLTAEVKQGNTVYDFDLK